MTLNKGEMVVLVRMLTAMVHPASEGGYWAEVLELPGCVSQGETLEQVQHNIKEAIQTVSHYSTECHDESHTTFVGIPVWETSTSTI